MKEKMLYTEEKVFRLVPEDCGNCKNIGSVKRAYADLAESYNKLLTTLAERGIITLDI